MNNMNEVEYLKQELRIKNAEIESLKRMTETFGANIPSIQAEAAKAAIHALFEVGNCPQYENGAGDGYIECGDALEFADKYAEQILKPSEVVSKPSEVANQYADKVRRGEV